jgi:23S rRNA (guanine2445-N2)-methyltransferase / 23S rRNA (guanine2069-N7)-methyltransferase
VSAQVLRFQASSPRGLADLLAQELRTFGALEVRDRATGVAFEGMLTTAYRACLWSRIANRIFLEIASFEAPDAEAFYSAARELDWTRHIGPSATLACDFSGRHPTITHTHFGALKLKDAICDALRAQAGYRPDIARDCPSVRVHAHAHGTKMTVAIDLAGESLHRRGYRSEAGEAPLKENVAAGALVRAGWPQLAQAAAPFLDPLCGSGTFVIEAAMIAANIAPGLNRRYFGFLGWNGHDAASWRSLLTEAQTQQLPSNAAAPRLHGTDRDATAIRNATAAAQRAGIGELVRFRTAALEDSVPPESARAGLLCTNPPYGVRLQDHEAARAVHRTLGRVLRERFEGWEAAVLTGAPDLGLELGIRARRAHVMWNGAIECRLLRLRVAPSSFRDFAHTQDAPQIDVSLKDSPGARMFANRLTKNLKRLSGWAESSGIHAYRLYDADMPEYALAIDHYRLLDGPQWLYVQEYAAPASIDPQAAQRRRAEALSVLTAVTGVPREQVRLRLRQRRARGEQYAKLDTQARFHVVGEGGLKFRVNFDDYLDTGLFLDHRTTRARLRAAAVNGRFLNLYCYTGAATVYAAAAGARTSTSVDLSRTYLEWAAQNLALNALSKPEHVLIRADCSEWLVEAAHRRERFDLIFLDPPTFSNSKRMRGVLDIARDHATLIDLCAALLAPQGLLVFATNAQRFKLDDSLRERYQLQDVSAETLPRDYERNPRIHRCYEIRLP